MKVLPKLTAAKILQWADAYFERTGGWPTKLSGTIPGTKPRETWAKVHQALRLGERGCPGGSKLSRFLYKHRGVGKLFPASPLTVERILQWADDYHARTSHWPKASTEKIPGENNESWSRVDKALRRGKRGLKGESSLAELLAEQRDVPDNSNPPPLTKKQVLAWAEAHIKRTGQRPAHNAGLIPKSDGVTWRHIHDALRLGQRGLPSSGSLAEFFNANRLKASQRPHPQARRGPLSLKAILKWADEHLRRTGRWPNTNSGWVVAAPKENWAWIDSAFRYGNRGLKGGSTLREFLIKHRRLSDLNESLSLEQIYEWADQHYKRTGSWPRSNSGPVTTRSLITWGKVNHALTVGGYGLPGGSSLVKELRQRDLLKHKQSMSIDELLANATWPASSPERASR